MRLRGELALHERATAVLLILTKKLTLLNRPTSQLPLVRMQGQEFSVSPVTVSLNPRRHALARSKNVVITSESALRRTKEGSAFRSKFSAANLGEICFFGCPTPLACPRKGALLVSNGAREGSEGWVVLLCGSRLYEICFRSGFTTPARRWVLSHA